MAILLKVRLFEVFTSIEGEGTLYGTKTLFVRLAGCPFGCFYCDTEDALPMNSGTEYSVARACDVIEHHIQPHTYKVNFTGGEPLLQQEAVAEMARYVQSLNIPVYLESSCFDSARFAHVLPHLDLVKIEFKTRDSRFVDDAHHQGMMGNALECLRMSIAAGKKTYIKIVASSRTTPDDITQMAKQIFDTIKPDDILGFVIQPVYGNGSPSTDHLLKLYDAVCPFYPDVRVVPQMHKLIGAR